MDVRIERKMPDGSLVFCKDGTYFRLTDDDVYDLVELIEGGPIEGPANDYPTEGTRPAVGKDGGR